MIIQETPVPKSTFEVFVTLVDAVIWPFVLIIILIIFRKSVAELLHRLGSLKADKSGISLTFQSKLDKAKGLFKGLTSKGISKSGEIGVHVASSSGSPQEQLQSIRKGLEKQLQEIASTNNIDVASKTPEEVCEKFKEIGVFDIQKAQLAHTLLDLTTSPDSNISQQQVNEVKALYQAAAI